MQKAAWIASVGGVAVLNTHPERHFSGSEQGFEAYAEFLERVRSLDPWIVIPRELRTRVPAVSAACQKPIASLA